MTPRAVRVTVAAAATLILTTYALAASIGRTTHGFIAYYAASRLFLARELGPQIYDDRWFTSYVQQLTGTGVREIFGPNTPAMAMLALPVAAFPPQTARTIWLAFSIVLLAAAALALAGRRSHDLAALPLLLAMLSPSVFANLRTGQAYLFVFAAFSAAALALLGKRDVLAGILVGFAVIFKSTGWPLLVLIAVQRRLRAVAGAVGAMAAAAAVSLLVSGLEVWRAYPPYVTAFVERPASAISAYQTTWSLFRHACAACGSAVPLLIVAVAVVITAIVATGAGAPLWIAGGLVLSVLAAPVAEDHHFVSLAIVILLAGPTSRSGRDWWPWALAGLFMLVPLSVAADVYPRLSAAWLLWALTLREMLKSKA